MVVEDKGPLCLAVIIATLAVSSVFVFARVLTRTLIRPQFGWDDGLIVVTWALILAYNITMFISIDRGYGRHILDLTEQQTVGAVEAEVIGQFFAIASFPSGKASIAFLLHRIFPGRKLAWFLWTVVGANAVCFYVDAILILAQCQPVAFQWDHSIPGGSCWSSKVVIDWGFLTGVTGAVTDFVFALLPWYYIRSLQMGVKEKLSVGVALSMGLFAGACSILKIYYTSTLGAHADFTFDTVPLVIWSCTELALINIAACIPTLRPLYTWLTGEGRGAARTKPYAYPSGYGEGTGHFVRVSNRSNRSIQAGQEDEHALNIYHSKSYRVSFEESPETPSKPPSAYANHT
ncbi:hypothetical protein NLG97_g341 [Lecanicillium saksenae]|uniref:Uncharacterized protein n=1 Tax=Lecanicillium saksenae TaxID=468837 RepID=A0ACC1RAA3_9HYPO|nr:hypothetical protein NLG97_g341 [Lecanicillium saksenae]